VAGGFSGNGLGRRRSLGVNADVNITPLVDVALVLLIIFMITAPIMQGGIDVELPQAKASPLAAKDGVVVSIDRRGRVFIDDIPVTLGEFRATVRRIMDQRHATSVYVRGDRGTPYGNVVRVVAALHEAGITSAGLVTQEEDIEK
jgi:biopolymer transport protein ExbD/biopolymer transport protein TolR